MGQSLEDLFARPDQKEKKHIYSVSELTQNIKAVLEATFSEIWVEGEVSGISRIATGTIFFSLKDGSSLLRCVMFHSFSRDMQFELKEGIQVVCFGRIGVWEKDGKYQLYAQKLEPKGLGSLQLALEQLKERLEKEGLFAPERKKPIPYLPSRIGVVTSPTGAAIKDMLKVLNARFKDVHIILSPVRVQGEGAKEEIAQAIKDFNRFGKVDVMIVGRGGGSIEDLWAFNEEMVARAIYNSRIPVISAVGHERDWTIADLVADARAATPSVAAEMVIPKQEDLREELRDASTRLKKALIDISLQYQEELDNLVHRLSLAMAHASELHRTILESAVKKLLLLNPATLLVQYRQKSLDYARQIYVRMAHTLKLKESAFSVSAGKLSSLNPLNILARGYSVTFTFPEGKIVKQAASLKERDMIRTRLSSGEILSRVEKIE
jgi:exodeoxyribonuclease VII large subunit